MEQLYLTRPTFDKKYKVIIETSNMRDYFGMMDWVNLNSKDSVDVKTTMDNGHDIKFYFAFENTDDALIFKIKYSL